jgi:hypothetical protein
MSLDASGQGQVYDIAVSFAGEQRPYVEATVNEAKKLGLRVFYDNDMNVEWWGKNFIVEQRKGVRRGHTVLRTVHLD